MSCNLIDTEKDLHAVDIKECTEAFCFGQITTISAGKKVPAERDFMKKWTPYQETVYERWECVFTNPPKTLSLVKPTDCVAT